MKLSGPGARWARWSLPAALLLGHLLLGLWSLRRHGATFDEPGRIAAGYAYWTRADFRLNAADPPLTKLYMSLPLLLQKINFPAQTQEWRGAYLQAFGERLLFWSGNDSTSLLFWPRLMNLLLSVLLGWVLWSSARARWGAQNAALTLAFYCFSPVILANAALATTDFPAAFWVVLSALAFADFLESPRRGPALLCALAGATAFACKYTSVLLWPALAAALAWDSRSRPAQARRRLTLAASFAFLPAAVLIALFILLWPDARAGLSLRLWQASTSEHHAFLLGELSSQGWRWFYAVALAVKSTLPELAVLGALAALLASGRRRVGAALIVALSVGAAYFLAASFSRLQIGIRHMLPVYPMLAFAAAPAAEFLRRRPRGDRLALLLGLWQAACAVGVAPHFLSYFNEIAGGSSNGYRVLADSNLDWGQDLPALGDYLRAAGGPAVILSYFGTDSPERFGILAQQLRSTNAIQRRWTNPDRPPRELLVVSATNLDGVYMSPPSLLSWLKDRTPTARVAYSLFVYDVTRDADAHRRLAEIYAAAGDAALGARERRRAAIIDGD